MIHLFEGNLGHFFVILTLVSALLATYSYGMGLKNESFTKQGTILFYIHAFGVFGIIGVLFYLISNHYFEYHYVFSHSSLLLPSYYQISCFWEGQEGSFLLWMFWNAILGVVLISTNKFWKAPVMLVMSLTQVFLSSMILGVVVLENIKIGSSPFILLRDALSAPIFQTNPNFVPEDGNGLNPLLQNYWMVIHPPTLFLGFATTVVPFAYCIGGLIIGKTTEWVRPALPWAQFSAAVLGVGILMGAYWAYETLNFGGYWNWDPVENAIYVPWLVLVASIHVMIAYKKNGTTLKLSMILTVASFILVLYATFLTRSGILGNASVHSFTDLGLSGQLLIYLLAFLLLSVALIVARWKELPKVSSEVSFYTREAWIFMGAATLCFMAFQVLVGTSMPVYNEIASVFGVDLNMAPSADTYKAYSFPQLLFSILLAILSGTGQFFWWKKIDAKKLKTELALPFIISLVVAGAIIALGSISNIAYLALLVAGVYSVMANGKILFSLLGTNFKLSGGSITHIGVALMLIGILFSSGYSTILSKNYTSMVWSKDFPEEVNRDNLLLFINEPRQMHEYSMVYKGVRKLTREVGMVNENVLRLTEHPLKVVRSVDGREDTLTLINPENSYFEIEYTSDEGKQFTLFPRVQINETMDMIVLSPDIHRKVNADMYTHVRSFPDPEQEPEWSKPEEVKVRLGERFFINDYVATLRQIVPIEEIDGVKIPTNDVAVKAVIAVEGEYREYLAEPIFLIKDMEYVGRIDDHVNDLAFTISVQNIIPEENAVLFNVKTTQKDWIILEAVEKPWINVLWLGTFLLVLGFSVAIYRRYTEFIKMRDKGIEVR